MNYIKSEFDTYLDNLLLARIRVKMKERRGENADDDNISPLILQQVKNASTRLRLGKAFENQCTDEILHKCQDLYSEELEIISDVHEMLKKGLTYYEVMLHLGELRNSASAKLSPATARPTSFAQEMGKVEFDSKINHLLRSAVLNKLRAKNTENAENAVDGILEMIKECYKTILHYSNSDAGAQEKAKRCKESYAGALKILDLSKRLVQDGRRGYADIYQEIYTWYKANLIEAAEPKVTH